MSPVTGHSRLGGSSAHRWKNCTASVLLEAGLPEPETSIHALEGRAAHHLAELALTRRQDPAIWIGQSFEVGDETTGEFWVEVTEEMADAVRVYTDYVDTLATNRHHLGIEVRVDLDRFNPPEPMGGTADAVYWDAGERHLHVADLKYGTGVVVEAVDNDQFQMYATGSVVKLVEALGLTTPPDKITMTVVQPRAPHVDGPIRSWTVGFDTLVQWQKDAFEAAIEAHGPNPRFKVGDHCRWCRAKAVCPAQQAHAQELLQLDFADTATDLAAGQEITYPLRPDTLTPVEIARVLEAAPLVEDWISGVRSHATEVLRLGGEIPGWKVVQKNTHRQWLDEDATIAALRDHGLEDGELFTKKLVSPNQAEKALRRVYPRGTAPDVSALYFNPPGGPTLVPATDPRPHLATAEDDFPAIEPAQDTPPTETCAATTTKGERCKRKAGNGPGGLYCAQHAKQEDTQ